MNAPRVVTGAGPVGRTIAEQLAAAGHEVRVLTRSGSGPEHPLVERVAVDVRDEAALRPLLDGAPAVFHCVHAAYTAKAWRLELAANEQSVLRAAAGSVVVFPESLYSYTATDRPMTEDAPRDAVGGKRGVRAELLAARVRATTPTVSVVASDFFGPHVRGAHAGERMVPIVMAGRTVRVLATAAGTTAKVATIPAWVLRIGGVVPGPLRELAEMSYQLTAPFVMDSAHSQKLLGLAPTPLVDAARATVDWWQTQPTQ